MTIEMLTSSWACLKVFMSAHHIETFKRIHLRYCTLVFSFIRSKQALLIEVDFWDIFSQHLGYLAVYQKVNCQTYTIVDLVVIAKLTAPFTNVLHTVIFMPI